MFGSRRAQAATDGEKMGLWGCTQARAFLELEVAGAVASGLAQEGDTHGQRARVLGLSLQVLGWWLWLTPLFVLYRVLGDSF